MIGGKLSDFRHGTQAVPATLTDYTGKMRDVSLDAEGEEIDATVWGNNGYRRFEQSFKNATIEVEYKYDNALWLALAAVFNDGDPIIWRLSPDGATSTKPYASGDMVMTAFGTPVPVGELIVIPVTYRVDGAITFDSHP